MGVLARRGSLEVMYILDFFLDTPIKYLNKWIKKNRILLISLLSTFRKTLWRFNFVVVILNIPWAIFLFVRFILTCVFHVVGRTFENNFKNFNPIFIERKRLGK